MPSAQGLAIALGMIENEKRKVAASFTDPADASAAQLAAAFRLRLLSPVEALRAIEIRVSARNAAVNAFSRLDFERGYVAARESESRWRVERPASPIDGVPLTVKDFLMVRGWPTRRGSLTLPAEGDWSTDSPPVGRARAAGAVLFAQTTSSEFAWKAVGDSPLYGATRNPWSLDHTAGGSSAGAAAALAAGMGPLAIGTDGGGSVRIPAAFCGVVGFKATFGQISTYPPSPMGTLSNVGPMARNVEDAAMLFAAIGQRDCRDPFALGLGAGVNIDTRSEARLPTILKGLRVAYCPNIAGHGVKDPEIGALSNQAMSLLEQAGARVEVVAPEIPDPRDVFLKLWWAGASYSMRNHNGEARRRLDPGLARDVEIGDKLPAAEVVAAEMVRAEIISAMHRLYDRFDVIATPAVATLPLKVGMDLSDPERERHWVDWAHFSYLFNLTRQPALAVPSNVSRSGLPVAIQFVGPVGADRMILAVASAFEAIAGFGSLTATAHKT